MPRKRYPSDRRPRKDRQDRSPRAGGPEQPPNQPRRTPIPIPGAESPVPEIEAAETPTLRSIKGGKVSKLREHEKLPPGLPASQPPSDGARPTALPPVWAAPPGSIPSEELDALYGPNREALFPFRQRLTVPPRETPEERAIRERQEQFIHRVLQIGSVTAARQELRIGSSTYQDWKAQYPELRPALKRVLAEHNAAFIAEAARRALFGREEPVLHQGRFVMRPDGRVLTKITYSDDLLKLQLMRVRPDLFRSARSTEFLASRPGARAAAESESSEAVGEDLDLTKYSQEDLSNLRAILAKGLAG